MTTRKVSHRTVSRRTLVKGAVAGATVMMAGCSVAAANEPDGTVFDESFDIIVVGAGAAGLSAAITAAEENSEATILLLEKASSVGGNSLLSGGNYGAPCTPLQISQGETDEAFRDDSPDLYYNEKRKLGEYRSNPEITRVFADNALEGYEWLTGLGIEFAVVGTYEKPVQQPENAQGMYLHSIYNMDFKEGQWLGAMTKGRHHKGSVYNGLNDGVANITAMSDAVASHPNITLRTDSEVTEFLREGFLTGDVIGVVVGGKAIEAKRGVVLASGGYSANAEMCTKFDSRLSLESRNTGCATVTGESLIAAMDIGADTMNMDFVQIRMARSGISYACDLLLEKQGTYIDIDSDGNRFWKEMPDTQAFRSARLTRLYEMNLLTWWSISDSSAIEANEVDPEALEQAYSQGSVVKCDTLEALAETVGVPADKLQETFDRYNSFVDAGIDEDYGQENKYLQWKIVEPPFYAVPRTYYRQHTCGGVCTTTNAEVLDRHGAIIPRFYAAGEAMGGVHGTERNGGCGWTECVVFGRLAGKALAAIDPRP